LLRPFTAVTHIGVQYDRIAQPPRHAAREAGKETNSVPIGAPNSKKNVIAYVPLILLSTILMTLLTMTKGDIEGSAFDLFSNQLHGCECPFCFIALSE
jgi:hypothetical protein